MSRTRTHSITYRAVPDKIDFLSGFANAAYANADKGRSTTGYIFMVGEGAVSWNSKKQISNALLSTQAEYVALLEAAHKACWL